MFISLRDFLNVKLRSVMSKSEIQYIFSCEKSLTLLYILRHCINILFFQQTNHNNSWAAIFELNNKILHLSFDHDLLIFFVNKKSTSARQIQRDRDTRKAIFCPVTVCNKLLASQWNLTAQIDQMQKNLL